MRPARILIVDDSAVIRRVLSDLLASDPEIVVAGTAGNGSQALARISEISPDLVTLDIEMPGMNGLETLAEIRRLYPKLPVIMFSTHTEHGAAATLDALARGASDYVTKPSHSESSESPHEPVREELIRKIKSLCAVRVLRPQPWPTPSLVSARPPARIDVVAIGTSTGGPNALSALIPQLPADFPVPVVIVVALAICAVVGCIAESHARVASTAAPPFMTANTSWIEPAAQFAEPARLSDNPT